MNDIETEKVRNLLGNVKEAADKRKQATQAISSY